MSAGDGSFYGIIQTLDCICDGISLKIMGDDTDDESVFEKRTITMSCLGRRVMLVNLRGWVLILFRCLAYFTNERELRMSFRVHLLQSQ